MTSIFDLKTSVSELESSNVGIAGLKYEQVACSRDIAKDAFYKGTQHFKFETSGTRRAMMSRSYFRARFSLTNGAGAPLVLNDNVAPNINILSSMYQNCEFRIADKTVSRVTDFMPQIEALQTRMGKSKGWLDSIAKVTNFWESQQSIRQQQVSSNGAISNTTLGSSVRTDLEIGYSADCKVAYAADTGVITFADGTNPNTDTVFQVGDYIILTGGTIGSGAKNVRAEIIAIPAASKLLTVRAVLPANIGVNADIRFSRSRPYTLDIARNVTNFELIWQPPLNIMNVEESLPCMKGEFLFNPQTSSAAQVRAIESAFGYDGKVAGVDFKLELSDMYFYLCTVEGARVDDISYLLDLRTIRCQADRIINHGFSQRQFDVSPSTTALTVAYQDLRAGVNSALSCSKFKAYNGNALLPNEIPETSIELNLKRWFVNYGGVNSPSPDADPTFVAGTDYSVQRYIETLMQTGGYFDPAGSETIEEFHRWGAYYHQAFYRDASDRSTRVTVHQDFSGNGNTDVLNLNILLFDHCRQVARVTVSNGRITDVQLEDA